MILISQAEEQLAAEQLARTTYAETSILYCRLAPHMANRALGYKIFYGPPRIEAPLLFLGYQPGGTISDATSGEKSGERDSWPISCEYGQPTYDLANAMLQIWGAGLLNQSAGLNAAFFRAPNVREWKNVNKIIRNEVHEFSLGHVRKLIGLLKPNKIVAIGFETLKLATKHEGYLQKAILFGPERELIRGGMFCGVPIEATRHLSGRWSQPNSIEIELMREYFNASK